MASRVFTTSKPKLSFGVKKEKKFSATKEAERALIRGANILPQTGRVKDLKRDMTRKAQLPGKRVSKSGKTYWETRKNRSDAPGKNI